MPDFNLSDEDIHKLKRRYSQFSKERKIIHGLVNSYVADYRQFEGSAGKRYEYLRKKYISQSPDLTHLIFNDGNIKWSVYDISIVLGRHLTSIIRSIKKMENTESWCVRLLSLRENVKNANGRIVQVYQKEIFDLLLDLYEDEYLLRFSEPRRGDKDNAPEIKEVRSFWQYLKDMESFKDYSLYSHKKSLPDIPAMNWKDIIALMWEKVFNVRIWTVGSAVFAVCFEISRRFLGISLWPVIFSPLIIASCIILIHKRRGKPDILSDVGAGAFLFMLLWISASFSVDRLYTEDKTVAEEKLYLSPVMHNETLNFYLSSNVRNIKEYFYRISPDREFHSAGFMPEINPNTGSPYPKIVINGSDMKGTVYFEVKFIGPDDKESETKKFSFDIEEEKYRLYKQNIMRQDSAWITAGRVVFMNGKEYTRIDIQPFLFTEQGRTYIDTIMYGFNKKIPDTRLNLAEYLHTLDPYDSYLTIHFTEDDYIDFVSSYLIFKDGSSSDIRISRMN